MGIQSMSGNVERNPGYIAKGRFIMSKFVKFEGGAHLRADSIVAISDNSSHGELNCIYISSGHNIIVAESIEEILRIIAEAEPVKVKKVKKLEPLDTRFYEIWDRYPKKLGKRAALKHFLATVKTDKDWEDINTALDHYLAHNEFSDVDEKFVQHGGTWFNNWSDWVELGRMVRVDNNDAIVQDKLGI